MNSELSGALSSVYGGLLIVGGVIGWYRGSYASLIAGGGSGVVVVLLESAYDGGSNGSVLVPLLQTSLSGLLAYTMGGRWASSGKMMPAGLVTLLSAAMLLLYAARTVAAVSKR